MLIARPAPESSPRRPAFWPDEHPQATADPDVAADLARMFAAIDGIGHDPAHPDTGYHRFAWTPQDLALRAWFADEARQLGLDVRVDAAGNQWAWWGRPTPEAPGVTTGSHLDSVPDGGAFDGPLGVISALAAVRRLRAAGARPRRPLGIVAFSDEEGARFGIACFGSRVVTGVLPAADALSRIDEGDSPLRQVLTDSGVDPQAYGADPGALALTSAHVELHIEQGYGLAATPYAVALATHIWPHGRWRVDVSGEPNHAGTTPMDRRDDALLQALAFPEQARAAAVAHGARATVGRLVVEPGGANVIPGHVAMWLDARAPDVQRLDAVLDDLGSWHPFQESRTAATSFDAALRARLRAALEASGDDAPEHGTAAGHDAGILQDAGIPTAMLFVRNQTGASHTPAEHATLADCVRGVRALQVCLAELTGVRVPAGSDAS